MKPYLLALGITALVAGPLDGQDLIAIRAGRLVDVARGEVRANQVILVRGERIEAVQAGTVPIPRGARVIDLSAHTVTPGLIDLHAHLIGDISSSSPIAPLTQSGAQDALAGVQNARATLLAGFTTCLLYTSPSPRD